MRLKNSRDFSYTENTQNMKIQKFMSVRQGLTNECVRFHRMLQNARGVIT